MSELTKLFCKTQIERLSQRPFYPSDPAGLKELIRTLFEGAKSPEHAERIITRANRERFGPENNPRCPDSNDLWALCRTVPVDRKQDHDAADYRPPNTTGCGRCKNHVGYVVIERNGVTGSHRCDCGAVPPLEFSAKSEAA